jgi:hypothetical protein
MDVNRAIQADDHQGRLTPREPRLEPGPRHGVAYWTNVATDEIGRADLDGQNADEHFMTGRAGACGLAVAGGHLYWANTADGTIGRARTDGTDVEQAFVAGGTNVQDVAVLISDSPPPPRRPRRPRSS